MDKLQLEQEYEKQRKRILQAIRRQKAKGFEFEINLLPPKPKKITQKTIERLSKITPETIREKATLKPEAYTSKKKQKSKPKKKSTKPKTPKKTPKAKAKETRKKHYEKGKKMGKGKPPNEINETVLNLYDSFDSYESTRGSTLSSEAYDDFDVKSLLEDVISRLTSFDAGSFSSWSADLQRIKSRDVKTALDIIYKAVDNLGAYNVAKNIQEHQAEIDEIIDEIRYRGSGTDFKSGRDAVTVDIARLESILNGKGILTAEEARDLSDSMESYEDYSDEDYYSDVLE